MDLHGLPRPTRRPSALLLALHFVHAVLVAVVCWGLALTGALLLAGTGNRLAGAGYIALLAVVLVGEVALAAWLILRRRKILKHTLAARRALLERSSERARGHLVALLGYLEHRVHPAPVLYGLATADLFDGELNRAKVLLRRAGEYPSALELRAMIALSEGMFHQAQRLMTTAVALRPRSQEAWLKLAACEDASGNHDKAADLLQAAAKRWPKSWAVKRALRLHSEGHSLAEALLSVELPTQFAAQRQESRPASASPHAPNAVQ